MIRSACAARCQQRGVGLWACTCRQACCHPTRRITVFVGRSAALWEPANKACGAVY